MYKELDNFEELRKCVISDKEANGLDFSTRNRYPLRFVLFDNFRDCCQFVEFVQMELGVIVESVGKWLDPEYPDIMITYTELGERIKTHVKKMKGNDCIIAPFSELARFYDNEENKTFDALLKTIKAIEASAEAAEKQQRIYVPIVGLEGKMVQFNRDSQSTIWRLKSDSKELTYRLILTKGSTYGVKGLDKHFTITNNMQEWLNVWKDADKNVTPNIICTSRSIYANAIFAQPDNAFSFVVCDNAYEFLAKGLQLQFGDLSAHEDDGDNWNVLAKNVDLTKGFNFSQFVETYFSTNQLEDYTNFFKLWLDNPGKFERWLLARYCQSSQNSNRYIQYLLDKTQCLTGNDFIERMARDMTEIDYEKRIRRHCLMKAAERNVVVRETVKSTLLSRLRHIASKYNATTALEYFTGIAEKEKELVVSWIGKGLLSVDEVKRFYPDFYYYYSEALGVSIGSSLWLDSYMSAYKKSKISNNYTNEISTQINTLNKTEITFDEWYQKFSTVRSILNNRNDIEVYYWIDGLGIEWIPLIKRIIEEKNNQNIYLNEVKIARSLLPSTTAVNKLELQRLLSQNSPLIKVGDLDELAHKSTNVWPASIINEISLVRTIVEDIVSKFNGKKIAIISDHGITYLSQLCEGLNIAGAESNHHGRVATKNNGKWTNDNNYIRLDDNKTICALKHHSLCSKVPKGQGIHGGCTPEEVLVPIFIISNDKDAENWTSELLTEELTGTNPLLRFKIMNLPSLVIPHVEYNGFSYKLNQVEESIFETETLIVDDKCDTVVLEIGNIRKEYKVMVTTGATETDLFGGFI